MKIAVALFVLAVLLVFSKILEHIYYKKHPEKVVKNRDDK